MLDSAGRRDRALSTAQALLRSLPTITGSTRSGVTGLAGNALLAGYVYLATEENWARDAMDGYLAQAAAILASEIARPGLIAGATGLAWVMLHLNARVHGRMCHEEVTEIDEFAQHYVSADGWDGSIDLVTGLTGIGVYALSHPREQVRDKLLAQVMQRLRESARSIGDYFAWVTLPAFGGRAMARIAPEGSLNLGMAHGVPGVVAFLASCVRQGGPCSEDARRLLDRSLPWLLDSAVVDAGRAAYPYCVEDPTPARCAWCYGEPGVSLCLALCADALGSPAHARRAQDLIRYSVQREDRRALQIEDAGLCHGSTGLAHALTRLRPKVQPSGDAWIERQALHWYDVTLDACDRSEHQNTGRDLQFPGHPAWTGEGLLDGGVGAGLALVSAATSISPAWDQLLLMSAPQPIAA